MWWLVVLGAVVGALVGAVIGGAFRDSRWADTDARMRRLWAGLYSVATCQTDADTLRAMAASVLNRDWGE